MALRSSSSSSSLSYAFSYDVFLSFKGEDTRSGFAGNLYKTLCDKGIHTFIYDEERQRGGEITSSLEKAIQESRIFVIVLSENYASSSFSKGLLENEWNHVEMTNSVASRVEQEEHVEIPVFIESGIYIFQQRTRMEDTQFTDPYSRKRKLDDDSE